MISDQGRSLWAAVVEAEERFVDAVAALPRAEFLDILLQALGSLASRRAALRILAGADPGLTTEVLTALEPLLLVSHSQLSECRRIVSRLPREEVVLFLEQLTEKVIADSTSDYEAFRRLAEYLSERGATRSLQKLVNAALRSKDPDIQEVAEDFG